MNSSFFKTVLDILFLKGKPSDLPYSTGLLLASAVLSILTAASLVVSTKLITNPVGYCAVQLIAFAAFYFLILNAHKVGERFVQSCTAIFAINTLFQCLTYVLSLQMGIAVLSVVFTIWNLSAQIYILKETLEVNVIKAILLCLSIQIVSSIVLLFVFPETIEAMRSAMQQTATAS